MLRPIVIIGIFAAVGLFVAARIAGTLDRPDSLQEKVGTYREISADQRKLASGKLSELPKSIRHFFDTAEDYQLLPEPGPGDWLSNHAEEGQSYRQFTRGEPNYPTQARQKIYLLPVGDFDDAELPGLQLLREFTASFFMLETQWLPAMEIDPSRMPFKVHDDGRRQLYSEDALQELVSHVPNDAFCVLAVTQEDLVPHGAWNFVFGQASLRDRVGIFSFLRFDPHFYGDDRNEEADLLVTRRRCGVLAHEIGHMFGIKHCIYYHCLMNGSNSLTESDAAPLHLCPVCLRKLYRSVNFDVAERERKLAKIFQELGLETESQWHQRRLDRAAAE